MGCGSSSASQPAKPAPAAQPTLITQPVVGKPARPVSHFQIELQGQWKDYDLEEGKILKRAYMSGFSNAKYELRGHKYEYDFKKMQQQNIGTGKMRKIRPPMNMTPPPKPLVAEGPTMVIKVRPGQAGKKIYVPHPKDKSMNITVVVPARAKTGQELLIPIPEIPTGGVPRAATAEQKQGWSTGAKVAGGATAVGAAALLVGGAILYTDEGAQEWVAGAAGDVGEFAAPHAEAAGEWATGAAGDVGTWAEGAAEDIAEWVPDAAEDAGEWIVEAGDSAGAFVMDLFG